MSPQKRITTTTVLLGSFLPIGCHQPGSEQPREEDHTVMPYAHVAPEPKPANKPPERIKIPPGATVETVPAGAHGYVQAKFVHVDENHRTWLDLKAPVYEADADRPRVEGDFDVYVMVTKQHDGRHEMELWPSAPQWRPSPKPADTSFVPLTVLDKTD
jgi:hypothetical protein